MAITSLVWCATYAAASLPSIVTCGLLIEDLPWTVGPPREGASPAILVPAGPVGRKYYGCCRLLQQTSCLLQRPLSNSSATTYGCRAFAWLEWGCVCRPSQCLCWPSYTRLRNCPSLISYSRRPDQSTKLYGLSDQQHLLRVLSHASSGRTGKGGRFNVRRDFKSNPDYEGGARMWSLSGGRAMKTCLPGCSFIR